MNGIVHAAEQQLDREANPGDVNFREIAGGVLKLAPDVFVWLHKTYDALRVGD